MAQSTDGGEKPPWNCGILACESGGTTTLMGTLEAENSLGNRGKTWISLVGILLSVNIN